MRRAAVLAIWAIAITLGAIRDFFFYNLNYQLDAVARQSPVSYAHSMFQGWVQGWDLAALLRLKWVLAFLFAGSMLLICLALARVLFGDHRHRRAIMLAYLLFGGLALALHGLAGVHPAFGHIGVKLLHSLQYPVVLFLFWAAALLTQAQRSTGP